MDSDFGTGYLVRGDQIVKFPPKTEHHSYIRERPELFGLDQSQWLQEVGAEDLFKFLFEKGWVRMRFGGGVLNAQGEKKSDVRRAVSSLVMKIGMPERTTVEWLGTYSELDSDWTTTFINSGRIPMKNPDDENDFDTDVGCATAMDFDALAFEYEHEHVAANPPEIAHKVYLAIKRGRADLSADALGLHDRNMLGDLKLSAGASAKLGKSVEYSYWTLGLYLISGNYNGFGADLCPNASMECRKNCLLVSGQRANANGFAPAVLGRVMKGLQLGKPIDVGFLRTWRYLFNYPEFARAFDSSLEAHGNFAYGHGLELAVRLNATSDIPWEDPNYTPWPDRRDHHAGHSIINDYPEIQFYDYTKNPWRAYAFAKDPRWPRNYYLTFSYSEVNLIWCLILLKMGVSVTIPFDDSLGYEGTGKWRKTPTGGDWEMKKPILPTRAFGYNVVDGDLFDMRFFEQTSFWKDNGFGNPPYIVGLRVKGNYAKQHPSPFFFNARLAQDQTEDDEITSRLVGISTAEAIRQKAQLPSDYEVEVLPRAIQDAFFRSVGWR